MAFTDEQVKIAQTAQALATLEPMSSFEDSDSLVATLASEIYDKEVEFLLCEEPYRFATAQTKLNHLTDEPLGRFTDAWQIPTEPKVLAIRTITVNDRVIEYERYTDKIFCDYDENNELIMDYIYRADESDFPADFKSYVIYSLASVFAGVITRNLNLVNYLEEKANRKFQIVKRNYSQGQTVKKVNTSGLIRSRL